MHNTRTNIVEQKKTVLAAALGANGSIFVLIHKSTFDRCAIYSSDEAANILGCDATHMPEWQLSHAQFRLEIGRLFAQSDDCIKLIQELLDSLYLERLAEGADLLASSLHRKEFVGYIHEYLWRTAPEELQEFLRLNEKWSLDNVPQVVLKHPQTDETDKTSQSTEIAVAALVVNGDVVSQPMEHPERTYSKDKEEEKQEKTMSNTTTNSKSKKDLIVAGVKKGAQVGLADEAGNVVLQFANSAANGKLTPYLQSAEGRALAKLVAATLLLHGIEFVSDDDATRTQVAAGCSLVIEAASRDFLQPKMAELRQVGLDLAKIGAKASPTDHPTF